MPDISFNVKNTLVANGVFTANSTLTQSNNLNVSLATTTATLVVGSLAATVTSLSSYSNTAAAIYGQSNSGYGVQGQSNTFPGVFGSSNTSFGVQASSNTGAGVYAFSNSGTGVFAVSNANYGIYAVSNTSVGAYIQSNTGVIAQFANATTTFAYLAANGNLGIGTTTPIYKLQVSGSIQSSGGIYAGGAGTEYGQTWAGVVRKDQNANTGLLIDNENTGAGAAAQIQYTTGTGQSFVVGGLYDNAGFPYYQIVSGTAVGNSFTYINNQHWGNTSVASGPHLSLVSNGNLGIGITTPNSKLAIQSTANGIDTFSVGSSDYSHFFTIKPETSLNTAQIGYWTGSNFGNVGIAASFLNVSNVVSTGLVNAATLSAGSLTATANAISAYSNTTAAIYGQSNSSYGVHGQSNSLPGVYGISNTNAGVQGVSNTGYGVLGQSNSLPGVYGISNTNAGVQGVSNTGYGIYAVSNTSVGAYIQSNTGTVAQFTNATTTFATLVANGNLGIATSTPGYKLDVAGIINSSTGGFRFPDGTTQISAGSPAAGTTFGIPGTVTLPNGLIMKWGYGDLVSGTLAVSFSTAFPHNCLVVFTTPFGSTAGGTYSAVAYSSQSATGVTFSGPSGAYGFFWLAIGY